MIAASKDQTDADADPDADADADPDADADADAAAMLWWMVGGCGANGQRNDFVVFTACKIFSILSPIRFYCYGVL